MKQITFVDPETHNEKKIVEKMANYNERDNAFITSYFVSVHCSFLNVVNLLISDYISYALYRFHTCTAQRTMLSAATQFENLPAKRFLLVSL